MQVVLWRFKRPQNPCVQQTQTGPCWTDQLSEPVPYTGSNSHCGFKCGFQLNCRVCSSTAKLVMVVGVYLPTLNFLAI